MALEIPLRPSILALHSVIFRARREEASPPFHKKILEAFAGPDRLVVAQAFRGAAKTSLAEEVMLLEAVRGAIDYGIIVGNSLDSAIERVAAIKYEIESNETLIEVCGELKGETWREDEIVLANGTKIKAFGVGQQIRGKKEKRSRRPDFIVCDDLEDEENARTPEARKKLLSWVMRALYPALHPKKGRLRLIGTPMDTDSLIVRLSQSKDFVSLAFPVMDADGNPLWPERFGPDEIERIRNLYHEAGDPDGYEQEYLLNPRGKTETVFEIARISRTLASTVPEGPTYSFCDPARSVKSSSARTAHVVWRWIGDTLVVLEAKGHFHKPSETIGELFRIAEEWDIVEMGVEKDGLEEYLMEPLYDRMREMDRNLPVEGHMAPRDRDKIRFMMGLQPLVQAGKLMVTERCEDLIRELEMFPRGRVDVVNALAYAPRMRRGKPVYSHLAKLEDVVRRSGETWLCGLSDGAHQFSAILVQPRDRLEIVESFEGSGTSLGEEWLALVSEVRRDDPAVTLWLPEEEEKKPFGLASVLRRTGRIYHRMRDGLPGSMEKAIAEKAIVFGLRSKSVRNAINGGYQWEGNQERLREGPAYRVARLCEAAWERWRISTAIKDAPSHYRFGG